MSYLLDTNACSAHLSGRSQKLTQRLRAASASQVAICSVVRAEPLYGARKSAKVDLNLGRLAAFFAPLMCLPFDDAAAEQYGLIRFSLEQQGTPIGPNDLMIAATALASGRTVVTANEVEFRRVPELAVENWQ
ncbi:MAG: type II toxin-antitoxin system VapC family toxin [Polyangiaceae bacterium]|nr:type II toxin-antitoxin system VapC family toxin [Polyangiaceae bacterium]